VQKSENAFEPKLAISSRHKSAIVMESQHLKENFKDYVIAWFILVLFFSLPRCAPFRLGCPELPLAASARLLPPLLPRIPPSPFSLPSFHHGCTGTRGSGHDGHRH
jgi:hypothetical protein